jgi:hypothetical protein
MGYPIIRPSRATTVGWASLIEKRSAEASRPDISSSTLSRLRGVACFVLMETSHGSIALCALIAI